MLNKFRHIQNHEHFVEGIIDGDASAVSTANLFNFIADGLIEIRKTMIKKGLNMASWDLQFYNKF